MLLPNDHMARVTTQFFDHPHPFTLRGGDVLPGFRLAYETHGTLNAQGTNAVLLFHALTGSHHVAGYTDSVEGAEGLWNEECRVGWWDEFVGPGLALDTNRFFVICANYIGGCYGSTGPATLNPQTGVPWGRRFPRIKIADIVETQALLLDHLGIETLHAAVGNSVGGLLSLTLAILYPDRVKTVVPVASSVRTTALQRITTLEQIYAIENDPNFRGGDYYDGPKPDAGLALARMISHKTFISLRTLEARASDELRLPEDHFSWYRVEHPVESYMLHQGRKFVQRFDANTYLRILEAWQRWDLLSETGVSSLETALTRCQHQNYLVFSISTDVCFYPEQQARLVDVLKGAGLNCIHITVHSDKGHDSFLLEPELFTPHLSYMLGVGMGGG